MPDLNEHTFEIRYKPNPTILDFRGYLAQSIASHTKLTEWGITDNRIDVHDPEVNERIFVGFKNAGYVLNNATSDEHFYKKAQDLYEHLSTLKSFGNKPFIHRIGIRVKFLKEFDGSFERLKDMYASKILTPSKFLLETLDAKVLDIGGPLDLEDKLGKFHIMSGPMIETQATELFAKKKQEFPPVGFYFDIDYSSKPERDTDVDTVIQQIENCSKSIWSKFNNIASFLFK